jgi:hypothetical protein
MPWLDQSELSVQPQLEHANATFVNAAPQASTTAQLNAWGCVFMEGLNRRRAAMSAADVADASARRKNGLGAERHECRARTALIDWLRE